MNKKISYLGEGNPNYGRNKYGLKKDILEKLYNKEKLSVNLIANKFNCDTVLVQYYLKKFGIKIRSAIEGGKLRWQRPETRSICLSGKNHPNYKHGKYAGDSIYKKLIKNSQCELCGKKDGQIDRHHKDGNHFNNNSNNFLIVCAKCHGLIHKTF